VVIPCYNQARFLGEAIESVLAQSYPHFEIVVVDDGSRDGTSEVAARYPNVRCVRQPNLGLAAARNSGLRRSESEYVVFLDADDRLLPEALEAGLECFDVHPECAFVSGRFRFIAADGSLRKEYTPPHVKDHYLALLRRNYIAMHATVMYRRAVFEVVGGFEDSLKACEDYDLYLRIARKLPICHHDRLVAEYRLHDANMRRNAGLMLKSALTVLRTQWKYAKEDKRHKEAYRAGVRFWQSWYGDPLVDEVRANVQEGDWKRVVGGILVLLQYYPRGLALLSERRMERRKLAQELAARKQKLKARRKKLEIRGQQLREFESTPVKERQEAQRLRKRTQRLTLKVQNLDQRLQNMRGSRAGRFLRKLLRKLSCTRSHKQQVKNYKQQVEKVRGRLAKERRRSERLRKRNQRLTLQAQNLARQVQNTGSSTRREHPPPVGQVSFGSFGRVTPISRKFGFDRGQPVDRYYIENFLTHQADDIRGRVLEIGDDTYTRQHGGERVEHADVLHVTEGNPQATFVADLTSAEHVPSDAFDCIIFTQTLHLIYDVRSAIRTLYRILKPGGVLLATFPGISQIAQDQWGEHWYWAFTTQSARRLFEETFPAPNVEIEAHGNVLAAVSFLHGLAVEELNKKELDRHESAYEILITLRAVKPEATP